MSIRLGRTFAISAIVVVVVAAILLVFVHTAFVRTRTFNWVVGLLESRYGLVLSAREVSYNLFTGTASLDEVRLAARGHEDAPFFTATTVRADVPLSAYTGSLVLDQVDVDRGRVRIVTDANGVTNLPGGDAAAEPPAEPLSLAIRGLGLNDFAFEYEDAAGPTRIAATGIDADLGYRSGGDFDGILGPFAVRGGVDLTFGERNLRLEPIDTTLGFDGRNVWLPELPLRTAMLEAAVTGRIDRVLDAPALDLAFDGRANLAEATTWAASPIHVSGTPVVKGSVTGPVAEASATIRFDGSGLTVGDEADLTASGEVTVDANRLEGHRVHLAPASGGAADATFEIPFGEGTAPRVDANWRGLDARAVLRLAGQSVQPIGTRLDGQLTFVGGASRAAALDLDATALPGRGVTIVAGRARAELNGDQFSATHDLRVPGLATSGTTSGRIDDANTSRTTVNGPSSLTITSLGETASSLAPFGIRLPAAVQDMAGTIEADVTIAGTVGDPSATIAARAPALDLPATGPAAISANIVADRRLVTIEPIEVARGETTVLGGVEIDLAGRTLGGKLEATSPDMKELLAEVPERWQASGPLSATATLGGSLDEPRIDVTLDSPTVEVAGETFEALHGAAVVTGTGVDVSTLSVRKQEGRIEATGRYGFDRSYTVNLDVTEVAWEGVIVGETTTRAAVSGTFEGTGTVDDPLGRGQFTIAVTGGAAGDLIGEGTADLVLAGDHARLTAQLPALGAFANGTVALASPFAYRAVTVVNHVEFEEVTPFLGGRVTDVIGRMSMTASVDGEISAEAGPQVFANVQHIDATVAGVPLSLVAPAQMSWQGGELTVRELVALLGTSTITAYGTWAGRPDAVFFSAVRGELNEMMTAGKAFGLETEVVARGPVSVDLYTSGTPESTVASVDLSGGQVTVGPNLSFASLNLNAGLNGESLTIHALNSSVTAEKLSGSFAATGKATVPELDAARASGAFTIDKAQFDMAGVVMTQTRPSTFSVADRVLTLDDVQWEAEGSAIIVGGTVDFRPEDAPALDLQTRGIAVLRALSALAPTLGFDGTADLDIHIGGNTDAPNLTGTIGLKEAEIALQSPRVIISELTGPITLMGNRIELRGLHGSANGGALVVDGGFLLDGAAIGGGEVYVQVQGAAVEYPRGLRSEVDALVIFDADGATPLLTGDVRILQSAYTEALSLAALARNANTSTPNTNEASALDTLRLNISVTTVEDLVVNNNYGRFEGGASLRLVGTAGAPGLTGRVTLREGGSVFAAGRTFTLNRGTITFSNVNRIEPDLDIEAQTRVTSGQIGDVTLSIQGTPSQLTTELTSSEGASREEIASALFGGGVTGSGAVTLLTADILGATGQQLGLSALRLDQEDVAQDDIREDPGMLATDEDPTTRLTMSRRIRDNVEFTLSQNLRESGGTTFIVSYFPLRNLELRAISRDNTDYGLALRHLVQFGGTPSATATERAPAPEIASMTFVGELAPFTEAQLQDRQRARVGDRFEFFRWQQNLDRLTEAYTDLGYLEARVRGSRTPRDDGRIDVTFTVDRGPMSRLVVEGIALSDGEMDDIREAWRQSVFDRFLTDDAEARVRRRMLADGYIEGEVTGTIEVEGDTKTLRLMAQPGVRAERRDLRFSGNTISQGQLETVVEQAGQSVDAWIDPERLIEALERFYRDEGYLQASVTVEPPRLEGNVGVLPVTIDEGLQASIGTIYLSGVSPDREATVREALALEAPVPYTAANIEAARERVQREYRRAGFNSVDVRADTSGVEPGEPLTLTVTVTEGLQEILRDVETFGGTRTRPGVIDRALRLRVGEPVNLEEWAESRRRLYDTNVFRTVDIEAVPMGEAVDGIQPVRARVRVEEYPPWRLRYGFQIDREREDSLDPDRPADDRPLTTNIGGIVDLRNQNLFGRALTGGIATRVERDYLNNTLFLSTATTFGLPVRSALFAFDTLENVRIDGEVAAETNNYGVSFEQRWRRRFGVEVSYGYRYERILAEIPESPTEIDPVDIGKLTAAVIWDRRDDRFNATRGTFSSLSIDQGASWLGSDAQYGKFLTIQQLFVPLGGIVLASRGMYGDAYGGPLGGVLRDDRFFAGGATTVRGYTEDSLGPRDLFGLPLGGDKMVVLNQEMRFPVRGWLRGVAFVDAGNVFNQLEPETGQSLKLGYGVGLRINSPVGLLRVDYGIPASMLPTSTRRSNSIGDGRWYFGFGHIF